MGKLPLAILISYSIEVIKSEYLMRLNGERHKPTKNVKKIRMKDRLRKGKNLGFLKNKKIKQRKNGKVRIKAEILVAKPIPEIRPPKRINLNLGWSKNLSDKKILAEKTKIKIDSVVPKWAD